MAIAKPGSKSDWVENNPNLSTIAVEPTVAKKDTGWISAERPSFQNMNWIFYIENQWTKYLESITDDHIVDIGNLQSDVSALQALTGALPADQVTVVNTSFATISGSQAQAVLQSIDDSLTDLQNAITNGKGADLLGFLVGEVSDWNPEGPIFNDLDIAAGAVNNNISATTDRRAQSYIASDQLGVDSVTFNISNITGSPTGNLVAELRLDNAGEPGTLVSTSDQVAFPVGTGDITFDFSVDPLVTTGSKYWVVLNPEFMGTLDGANNFDISETTTSGQADLSKAEKGGDTLTYDSTGGTVNSSGGTGAIFANEFVVPGATTYTLNKLTVRCRNFSGFTGNWVLNVYADDGSGNPDETTVLGTATINASGVGATLSQIDFPMDAPLPLTTGTYWIGYDGATQTGFAFEAVLGFTAKQSFDGGTVWGSSDALMLEVFSEGAWVVGSPTEDLRIVVSVAGEIPDMVGDALDQLASRVRDIEETAVGNVFLQLYDAVVGSPTQVSLGEATHSDPQLAHDSLSNGERMFIRSGTHSTGSSVIFNKQIVIEGQSAGAILTDDVTISSDKLRMRDVNVANDLTVGGNGNIVDGWVTNGGVVTNSGTDNILNLVTE